VIEQTASPDGTALSLIARLAQAHVDGMRLARALSTAAEAMDQAEAAAAHAFEWAAQRPWDDAAADRAMRASSVYEDLAERDSRATVDWAAHRLRVAELLDEAEAVAGPVSGGQPVSLRC